MLFRVASLVCVALGLMVVTARAEEKKPDPNRHEGKLVKIAGNKLTMTDKEGKTEHTHTLAPDAKISCDGKECKAEDLKPGVRLVITTKEGDKETALRVEASTKEEPKKDK
jgi:hypothetical protein